MSQDSSTQDLQEPIKLIREMTAIIDPADDYMVTTETEEQMKLKHAKRKRENEELHLKLKSLTRALEAARKSSTRDPSAPTADQHVAHINELDAARMSLVKSIRDAESELASKEAELAALKEEVRTLTESDPAGDHQKEMDGTLLRFEIFRGLGFEPIIEDGEVTKMLVRSESGDVHLVPLDKSRSDFETANLLWKLSSS